MSGNNKRPLVPRLRFPEFREGGEWESAQLDQLISTITPPKKIQTTDYLREGQFPIIDQGQSDIAGWTNDAESLIDNHQVLIVFGDHTCSLKLLRRAFAQGADGIKILKGNALVSTDYLYQFLHFRPVIQEEYKRHFAIFKAKVVAYPERQSGEQQKIADCLTSLDDLITAHSQKLDKLKAHKKGLMQQLFPAEGETVPRLRFAEFDGELSSSPLGSVAYFVCAKISIDEITADRYVSTENLLPDFGGMSPSFKLPSVSSVTCFQPEDILISNIRPYLKKVWKADIRGGVSNDVLVVRSKGQIGAGYLAAILRSDFFIDYVMRGAKGVKMPRGEIPMIREFPVPCSCHAEQQKIADCLSSLDDLITAQNQKLEALKAHKKGLMQQLFPVMDEGAA
ncbi:hypothetical protein SIID45300_01788 [Candidatus Magnetaquicoccaceae bacterium FCR-1]|uniref:Restriction endonuclease subunit S n=1 Tax=Candidatus Magnetaquiglobus chichijimensis TaxID=3141448 RepID=A0ABQ0C9B1_9PROT